MGHQSNQTGYLLSDVTILAKTTFFTLKTP